MGKCAIYARVSTDDQHCEMQLADLRRYAERQGWEAVEYVEKESSVKRRPVFNRALEDARAGKFDVLLVWRIDRFARSMKDFVSVTLQLDSWKVGLVSVTESVDSRDKNPFAKFMIGLLALLAELERGIILQRVNAGLASYQQAYAEGHVGAGKRRQSKSGKNLAVGRPKRVFRRDEAARLRAEGMSWRKIGKQLGVPEATIRLALSGAQKP